MVRSLVIGGWMNTGGGGGIRCFRGKWRGDQSSLTEERLRKKIDHQSEGILLFDEITAHENKTLK